MVALAVPLADTVSVALAAAAPASSVLTVVPPVLTVSTPPVSTLVPLAIAPAETSSTPPLETIAPTDFPL